MPKLKNQMRHFQWFSKIVHTVYENISKKTHFHIRVFTFETGNKLFLAWKLIFLHHVVHSKMQFHFGSWHDAMAAFKRLNQIPRGNEMILRKMKLFECCWFGPSPPLVISVHQLPVLQAMQKHQAKVRQSSFQTSIVIRKDNKILLEATFEK